MIFQNQHSETILSEILPQVKEKTPLRKILEKKLEKRKSHYN